MVDRQALEDKITKAEADTAAAEEALQQDIGEEQLRTSISPSHQKIRNDKDLPSPNPDLLPPEDGGHQLDPKEVEDNRKAFDKADLSDPHSIEEAKDEVTEDKSPTKPATLGDTTKRK